MSTMREFMRLVEAAQRNPLDNPAFRRWFGYSKVVDEHGRPLVCYHGSRVSFDEFRPADGRFSAIQGLGNWFASTPKAANRFTKPKPGDWEDEDEYAEPNVIPVYLRIERPFVVEKGWNGLKRALFPRGYDEAVIKAAKERIVSDGHDGIIMRDSTTDYGGRRTDFVIFSPKQAKSIFARDFNPESAKLSEGLTNQ